MVAHATQANHRNTNIKNSSARQLAFDSDPAHYDMQSLSAGYSKDVKSQNITRDICSIAFSGIIACMARRWKQKKKGKMRPAKKNATKDFSHSSISYTNPAVGATLSNLVVDEK